MKKNKIDFKQKKYILPLLALPFILLFSYFISKFTSKIGAEPESTLKVRGEISTELGDVKNVEIMDRQGAYEEYYNKRTDGRTNMQGFEKEGDSLANYSDVLTAAEKREIDSLAFVEKRDRLKGMSQKAKDQQKNFAKQDRKNEKERQSREDIEYQRSMKMLEMLNGKKNQKSTNTQIEAQAPEPSFKDEQLSLMREQMMLLDSIEKSNNPELRAQSKAQQAIKENQNELDMYLNSTLSVTKKSHNANFNSLYKENNSTFIKAVIDEDLKGYLGSRIRLRLLEDVYVGTIHIKKGTVLYALISGFSLQRVNINIVSIMYQNEILPINLSIYDVDGMEGLYVPQSVFREMSRTLAQNSVQGQSLSGGNSDFFTNTLTSMFQSTSKSIADLIRKNKVKIKNNSFVYLIDNQELKQKNSQRKKSQNNK